MLNTSLDHITVYRVCILACHLVYCSDMKLEADRKCQHSYIQLL